MKIQFLVIPSKIFFYVKGNVYLFMKFTAVHEVKYLHHHESIEDECEMSRVYVSLVVY